MEPRFRFSVLLALLALFLASSGACGDRCEKAEDFAARAVRAVDYLEGQWAVADAAVHAACEAIGEDCDTAREILGDIQRTLAQARQVLGNAAAAVDIICHLTDPLDPGVKLEAADANSYDLGELRQQVRGIEDKVAGIKSASAG